MEFSAYFNTHKLQKWESHYIKYRDMRALLREVLEAGAPVMEPRSLSLGTARPSAKATPQERFFIMLEAQVADIDAFVCSTASSLRVRLASLQTAIQQHRTHVTTHISAAAAATAAGTAGVAEQEQEQGAPGEAGGSGGGDGTPGAERDSAAAGAGAPGNAMARAVMLQKERCDLVARARAMGQEYLELEGFVNLNYAALTKVLQAHDRLLPDAPCWAFYRRHVSGQAWVRGDHHDMQLTLGRIFSMLHTMPHAAPPAVNTPHTVGSSHSGQGGLSSALAAQQQQQHSRHDAFDPATGLGARAGTKTVEVSRKFWVRAEDVAEVYYTVLQHLPLVETPKQSEAAPQSASPPARPAPRTPSRMSVPASSSGPLPHLRVPGTDSGGWGAGGRSPLSGTSPVRGPALAVNPSMEAPPHALGHSRSMGRASGSQGGARHASSPGASGGLMAWGARGGSGAAAEEDEEDEDTVNLLYLDNGALELYHNLLYGRPYASLVRLRWVGDGRPQDGEVVVQRKVYQEGWRPETATKDSFPVPDNRVAEFLAGRWTFADAAKYLQRHQHHHQQWRQHPHTLDWVGQGGTGGGRQGGPQAGAYHTQGVAGQPQGRGGEGEGGDRDRDREGEQEPPSRMSSQQLAAEMEATQREYALFKAFTEVQRVIESKALQPVVQLRMRQTVFQAAPGQLPSFGLDPAAGGGRGEAGRMGAGAAAALAVRVQMDTDVRALLEYSTDGQARIANGYWRLSRHADAVDLPYACLKVQVLGAVPRGAVEGAGGAAPSPFTATAPGKWQPGVAIPDWLQALVETGKLVEVHDFSKFLFGCAGLLPDMVRAVPVWVDDPLVQRTLAGPFMAAEPPPPLMAVAMDSAARTTLAGVGVGLVHGAGAGALGTAAGPAPRAVSLPGLQAGVGGGMVGGVDAEDEADERSLRAHHTAVQSRHGRHHHSDKNNKSGEELGRSNSNTLQAHPAGGPYDPAGSSTSLIKRSSSHRPQQQAAENTLAALQVARESQKARAPAEVEAREFESRGARHHAGNLAGTQGGVPGWQLKLMVRQQSRGRAYAPQTVFVGARQMVQNEQLFTTWMNMAVLLSSLALGMFGFASSAARRKYPGGDGEEAADIQPSPPSWDDEDGSYGGGYGARHVGASSDDSMPPGVEYLAEWTGFILLVGSMALVVYALVCFLGRSDQFNDWLRSPQANATFIRYDSVPGSLTLMVMVILTFSTLLAANVYDLAALLAWGAPPDTPAWPPTPAYPAMPPAPDAPYSAPP